MLQRFYSTVEYIHRSAKCVALWAKKFHTMNPTSLVKCSNFLPIHLFRMHSFAVDNVVPVKSATFARKVVNFKIELYWVLAKNHGCRRRKRGQKQSISEIVLGKSNSRLVKSGIFCGHSREIARNKSTKSGENSPCVGWNNDVIDVTSSPPHPPPPRNGKFSI